MPNFNRTYGDLHRLILALYGEGRAVSIGPDNISNNIDSSEDCTRLLVAFSFLELDHAQGFAVAGSNRYLLDAAGINLLPTKSVWESFLNRGVFTVSARSLSSVSALAKFIDSYWRELVGDRGNPLYPDEFSRPPPRDDLDFLDHNGYLVVKNAIPAHIVLEARERLSLLARREALGLSQKPYFYGSGKLQRVYNLLAKDAFFSDFVMHPVAFSVLNHMFHRETFHQKFYLTSFHGNILDPGSESQIIHIDSNVPNPIPPWIIRANVNFITQDYTAENGATEVIPGSHKWLKKPSHGLECEAQLKPVEAESGSLVIWHGGLWHRSGTNRSGEKRVALLSGYCASHFREMSMEENPYLAFSSQNSACLGDDIKALLGWNHGAKDGGIYN